MYLKRIKEYFNQVGVRITLWYLLLLSVTTAGLFVVFYILYTQSLIKNEREVIEEKVRIYEKVYRDGGITSLKKYLKDQESDREGRSDFFVRVESFDHKKLYFYPDRIIKTLNVTEIDNFLLNNSNLIGKKNEWFYIKTKSIEDDLEMHNKSMGDGNFLQVGLKVDDRDDLLEHFLELYLILLMLAVVMGWFGGVFLSSRILSPLRNLIETLKNINNGSDKLRLKSINTNDEFADLTEQFNMMLEHVEKSNESMRSTLDIISHELRTPLTSFRAMAEMALAKPAQNTEDLRESVHELIEGIDEILAEFKMMMEITEMDSGSKNLNIEFFDIKTIIREVYDLYELVAEAKDITLEVDFSRSIELFGDKRKIKQALANLVDNAIKYSSEHSEVEIKYLRDDQDLLIIIKDHGIGISTDEVPLVFKRLYRGVNSRSQKGIGLGLSLVQTIISAHKGSIEVSSKLGSGSIFTVRIPLNL